MACSTTPDRTRLAQLLQEAQETQKYNTRRVEESYHALRTSTRRLELCWTNYCNELERELDVNNRKDIPRGPDSIEAIKQYQPDLDVNRTGRDKFPDLPSPERSSRRPPTGKPPSTHARPRSNNLQTHQHQETSPNVHGPRAIPAPTHTFPSRYNTTPSSRPKLAPCELQGSRPISASKINIPKRHASLPTREYLVALSTSLPSTPHHQQRNTDEAAEPNAMGITPPLAKLDEVYSYSNANRGNVSYGNAHHSNANQTIGKTYTVEAFKTPMTHEALTYEPGGQGHRGGPSIGRNTAKIEDQGLTRKHGSGGRARLHKKR